MTSPLPIKSEAGFSLLSLVFLILTLSISVVTVFTLINPSAASRKSLNTSEKARVLRAAIQSYQFSHGGVSGTNPPSLDDLVVTDGTPCAVDNTVTSSTYLTLQGWCGPYVDQLMATDLTDFKRDGWGTLFSYAPITTNITSCGPNLTCGDADDITYAP